MPRLERYHIDSFSAEKHLDHDSSLNEPVFMTTPGGQGAFEYLYISTYDTSAVKSARIGGTALLAGAKFNGHLSLVDNSGELTVRHHSVS